MFQTPCTAEEWKSVAQNFHYRWQFPNCIGALDGKHIEIVPPRGGGSFYYNYKGSHSIILLGLVDANLEFLYADVGVNGRSSDAAAWDISQLRHNLERNTLNVPGPAELPNSTKTLPHVIVGDDAFPLKPYLLKPYSFRNQSAVQRIFSYRLSRARRCVENAFGILANRFRVLLCPIYLEPEKVRGVVMACLALHNLLRKASPDAFTRDAFDSEDHASGTIIRGSWRTQGSLSGLALVPRNASNDAKAVRDQYCEYFNNEGSVPWQDNYM